MNALGYRTPFSPFHRVDDEVTAFFRDLGYEVDWDFSNRTGVHWYEISAADGDLICQIDMGVALDVIVGDLCALAAGRPMQEAIDYIISGPEVTSKGKAFMALCRRMAESQGKGDA